MVDNGNAMYRLDMIYVFEKEIHLIIE